MVLPAFSAGYISPRVRLILALAISLAIYLNQSIAGPPLTDSAILAGYQIFSELAIGIMIGTLARIIATAIHVAGMIMSMQSALAQAVLFDPNSSSQGAIFGNFMEILAVVLIFALDLHHLMIASIVDSYEVFAIGASFQFGDFAEAASLALAKAFRIGVQLAAPIIVTGILINLSSGLLARLMPAFQVFFVVMPVQIGISFFVFAATLSGLMMWYIEYLRNAFVSFTPY